MDVRFMVDTNGGRKPHTRLLITTNFFHVGLCLSAYNAIKLGATLLELGTHNLQDPENKAVKVESLDFELVEVK